MRKVDPEKREARRREILKAAMMCFARKGFHQTTTAEICAQAGMSPGNLFHYFASKDAIIAAIADEDRRQTAALFERLASAGDIVDGLVELASTLIADAADPVYAGTTLDVAAEATRNPNVAELFARNDAETKTALAALLRRAAERGQVDPALDPEQVATWLIVLVEGVVGRASVDPGFRAETYVPTLRILVERFLRPPTR